MGIPFYYRHQCFTEKYISRKIHTFETTPGTRVAYIFTYPHLLVRIYRWCHFANTQLCIQLFQYQHCRSIQFHATTPKVRVEVESCAAQKEKLQKKNTRMSGKSSLSFLTLPVQKLKFGDFYLLTRWVACVIVLTLWLHVCLWSGYMYVHDSSWLLIWCFCLPGSVRFAECHQRLLLR